MGPSRRALKSPCINAFMGALLELIFLFLRAVIFHKAYFCQTRYAFPLSILRSLDIGTQLLRREEERRTLVPGIICILQCCQISQFGQIYQRPAREPFKIPFSIAKLFLPVLKLNCFSIKQS